MNTAATPGGVIRAAEQPHPDLSLFELRILARLWSDLRQAGLLDADVPTPE
jgi:hypothetical protein